MKLFEFVLRVKKETPEIDINNIIKHILDEESQLQQWKPGYKIKEVGSKPIKNKDEDSIEYSYTVYGNMKK